jgi:RNA polymerase sigma-70 factor (ECF subfamily)
MAAAERLVETPISDEDLIQRLQANDRSAFEMLYERYFPRVYGYVRRRVGNPADVEEAVQETFINVFTAIDSFRGEAPFAAWVLGVARRTVAGRFKKKQHATVPLEDTDGEDPFNELASTQLLDPTPLQYYECAERLARLDAASREKLSADQRQLIELHHLQNCSVREIAEVLGRSEDAIKSNLYRARKLLLAS